MDNYFYYNEKDGYGYLSDLIKQLFPNESNKRQTKRLQYYRQNKIYDKQNLFTIQQQDEGYNYSDEIEPWGASGYYRVNIIFLNIPEKYKHPALNDWYDKAFLDEIKSILTH